MLLIAPRSLIRAEAASVVELVHNNNNNNPLRLRPARGWDDGQASSTTTTSYLAICTFNPEGYILPIE